MTTVSLHPAVAPRLNLEDAARHVELVAGSRDTEVFVRFLDDAKSGMAPAERHGTIEKLWSDIAVFQRDHYGVFLIPNATATAADFVRDEDIMDIRVVFIDADGIAEPPHWHVPPAFLIHTSAGKWHAYWIVGDLPVAEFQQIQRRLAAHYGTDPKVCNPSRVMRLAGTIHWKDPEHPQLVTLDDRTEGQGP